MTTDTGDRPCKRDALAKALDKIIDTTPDALSTLTMKTALAQAEVSLKLVPGSLHGRTSDHKEWADGVLYDLLSDRLSKNPNLLEEQPASSSPSSPKLKRPKTAVFLWSDDNRAKVKKENPKLSAKELNSKLRNLFASLDEKTREEYRKRASDLMKEYNAAQQGKKASTPPSSPSSSSKPAPKKAPVKRTTRKKAREEEGEEEEGEVPAKKRAARTPTGYQLFSNDMRAKVKEEEPGIKPGEVMKKLGELWRAASDETKKKYNDLAKKGKDDLKPAAKEDPAASPSKKGKEKEKKQDEKEKKKDEKEKPAKKKPAPKKK